MCYFNPDNDPVDSAAITGLIITLLVIASFA